MKEVEAFGSAQLLDHGTADLRQVFIDFGIVGTTAMPLGHNPGDDLTGAVFSVGANGLHKGHALTIGRTRGGKGVSTIIPALLTYAGSMVVIDPKGENAWITAKRRRELGQRVVILDPWGEVNRRYGSKVGVTEKITRFNPLSALNPGDPDFADDVAAIADAFILQTGNDPHWPDSARELTAGLIAAEVQDSPGTASMRDVRRLLRSPMGVLKAAVTIVQECYPDSLAANKLASIIENDADGKPTSNREISSIRSTARTQTGFLDSPRLLDAMETEADPFDLRELATGRVTLYLVLPVDRLRTHGRWLRMILTLAIRAISKVEISPKLPVTFILDELGTISPGSGLSMVEQSYGLMAGLGIRIWAFLQDLPQLKRDYPSSWETFIANSSVIQLLNVADNTTAKYFSDYLGNGTINAKTGQWIYKKKQWSPDEAQYHERVDIITRKMLIQKHGFTEQQAFITIPQQSQNRVHGADRITKHDRFPWFDRYDYGTDYKKREEEGKRLSSAVQDAVGYAVSKCEEREESFSGYMSWEPDTQLMSRPVMFPWEIVNADPDTCIIIMPGNKNMQLKRFVYFKNPYLSKWARADPNRISSPAKR